MTTSNDDYYATRFRPDPRRARLWDHLTRYLARYVPPGGTVLELGAGYCYFINQSGHAAASPSTWAITSRPMPLPASRR